MLVCSWSISDVPRTRSGSSQTTLIGGVAALPHPALGQDFEPIEPPLGPSDQWHQRMVQTGNALIRSHRRSASSLASMMFQLPRSRHLSGAATIRYDTNPDGAGTAPAGWRVSRPRVGARPRPHVRRREDNAEYAWRSSLEQRFGGEMSFRPTAFADAAAREWRGRSYAKSTWAGTV